MKKLKHSKYKNTGILFEMLVRKLTSETLSSNKSNTIDIIKKYFVKNTELSKELQLYNSLLKENFRSEAEALDYIRTVKATHSKLNQSILKRQRYNLVKEISEKFVFDNVSKIHISNYKVLASINIIFEHDETDNPKQLFECKRSIIENGLLVEKSVSRKDAILEKFESQSDSIKYDCCDTTFTIIKFKLHIRRRTLYYIFNLVFPCILISLMIFFGFILPPDRFIYF